MRPTLLPRDKFHEKMTFQIRGSDAHDIRPKSTAMNTSGAFPVNASIAPQHRAFWGRETEFEASWSYRLTIIGLVLWWVAYLYPLIPVVDIEDPPAVQGTMEGSLANRLLVISFAGLGGMYLPRAIRALR